MVHPARINGQCLCGAVTISVRDPAGWVGACHCRPCQRWSGGLWAGFPAAEDTVTIKGPVQEYASSAIANRAFCGTCGTHLWMRDVAPHSAYDLMPGIFDDCADWPLRSEVYRDQAIQAFQLQGAHKTASADAYRAANPQTREVAL